MTRLLNAFGEVAAWLLITPADEAVGAWLWLRQQVERGEAWLCDYGDDS